MTWIRCALLMNYAMCFRMNLGIRKCLLYNFESSIDIFSSFTRSCRSYFDVSVELCHMSDLFTTKISKRLLLHTRAYEVKLYNIIISLPDEQQICGSFDNNSLCM